MRKLYLGNGDKQFKFADTTTEIHLNAFDDGSAANLANDAKVRIKNDSGYLLGVSASITDNHAVITSGQLAQLPVGSYLIELWNTVDGGTAIYPSDGFLALQINENITGLSGGLVSSITVDDFIQQFSDLSQQLKQEVAVAVANGVKGDIGDDGLSAYQIAVINGYQGSQTEWLASLVGDKGDKGDRGPAGNYVPETFTNLAAIQAKYPNGANGVMVAADNGHKYIWANNVWTDAGVYQSVGIADGTVTTKKIAEEAVTFDKIDASDKTGNVLNLEDMLIGQYYGMPTVAVGQEVKLKVSAPWNGTANPIPVKEGDVVSFNKAIYQEYYIGVDDNNIVRQFPPYLPTLSNAAVTVATGVTKFYATVRNEHLSTTMITINQPMPSEYAPHIGKKVLEWLELSKKSVKKEHLTDDLINEMGMQFSGLVANFLGDSLTKGQYLSSEAFAWPALLGEKIGLATVNNYGISGSSVSTFGSDPMVSRYQNMNDDADIVFFMGSRNDFGSSTDEFGNISTPPSDTNTFFGALKNIAEGLKNKYPGKLIIFCTPPHGSSQSIPETRPNPTTGKVYAEYVQAIRDVANHYSIPVIDFWNNAGMQPLVEIDNQTYFKHSSGTIDGVHPNKTGHERLANVAGGFIKTLVS